MPRYTPSHVPLWRGEGGSVGGGTQLISKEQAFERFTVQILQPFRNTDLSVKFNNYLFTIKVIIVIVLREVGEA